MSLDLKCKVESGRKCRLKPVMDRKCQHFLHYDIRTTPAVHAEAGSKYDSTIGFNDNVGFRFGTCYPYHLYDLKAEKELPIMEISLIIQDGAMLNPVKGMRLGEDIG